MLALVVEGESDYHAVPLLLKMAGASVGLRLTFRGQGVASPLESFVGKKLLRFTRAAILARPSKVVVVIDREARNDCPGEFAQRVEIELKRRLCSEGYSGDPPVSVVCADRSLENWLIADPEGIRRHAYIERGIASRVGNNADGHDAVGILNWAYGPGRRYQKTKDAPALAARVRVREQDVRRRSKSLCKLLREAGV